MNRTRSCFWLPVVFASCFGSSSPPSAPKTEQSPDADQAKRTPSGTQRRFVEGVVHALRRCSPTAAEEIVIEIQTDATPQRAVFAMGIDLFHGARDKLPREFRVGGSSANRCDPGCVGTVWLDTVEPGKRVRGRFDLQWGDTHFAQQRFEVDWRNQTVTPEGKWHVAACPGPPDAYIP